MPMKPSKPAPTSGDAKEQPEFIDRSQIAHRLAKRESLSVPAIRTTRDLNFAAA